MVAIVHEELYHMSMNETRPARTMSGGCEHDEKLHQQAETATLWQKDILTIGVVVPDRIDEKKRL